MTSDSQIATNQTYATGSMCPLRGRALRYSNRLRVVSNLAERTIQYDRTSSLSGGNGQTSFGIAVHCLRQALRQLAFSSSVVRSAKIDGLSRFYTTHNYGAHFLNMMEMHNPGAYPVALDRASVCNQKPAPIQYLDGIKARYEGCLTPILFIWSWKICCLAINSLSIRDVWRGLSSGIRPRHIALALLAVLSCHMIGLYRRGYTWIVMHQRPDYHTAVIPLFNISDPRLVDPSLRTTEFGRTYRTLRYHEPRDWPHPPPELLHWLDTRQASE